MNKFKRQIEAMLTERGWHFVRHGGKHSVWTYPPTGAVMPVPRTGAEAPRTLLNYIREAKRREGK